MNKKILSNFLYQASYQLLLIIMPIVTIPVVSKALGPEGIGTYQYVFSIVNYFVLIAGLGLQNYGVREIAIVRENTKRLSKTFLELYFMNATVSMVIIVSYFFIVSWLDNRYLFYIQGLVILGSLFDISWFFGGLEEFKTITIRNFIVKIATLIAILVFINDKTDLVLYFWIMGISTLVSQLTLWITIKKYILWTKISLKDVIKHIKPSLSFFLAKIAFQFYYNVSLTLLGLFATMSDVGYFSNGFNLIAISGSIINALNTVMIPRMSNIFDKNQGRDMIKILDKTIHIQLYVSIAISFGIMTINNKMIDWFYGPNFAPLNYIVPLLAVGLTFQILQTSIASQYLIPRREMREYNKTVIIGAVVNFIIDIILIPYLGIYGAIIGYLISYGLLTYLRSRVLLKATEFSFHWNQIVKNCFSGFLMWGIVYLFTNNMQANILTTFVQCLFGAMLYLLISTVLKSNPIANSEFIAKIINKLRR
jgi:Membrane protein involved in the export of O-antigen and teichoic acid